MVKDRPTFGSSSVERLKQLRISELDVEYRKQLRALKRIIKNGRIHFGGQLKNK
jgi:hypothetical protein